MTEIEAFARYRERAGLIEKYESTRRHHISLHTFRSYFFIRARRIHDTDIAHAMVGHTTYLDMYDRKEDSEKLELFLMVEPSLKKILINVFFVSFQISFHEPLQKGNIIFKSNIHCLL